MNESEEVSDKVRFYENELQKRDELICKLSKVEVNKNEYDTAGQGNEAVIACEQMKNIKSKLCILQKNIDDKKSSLLEKDIQIRDLIAKIKRLNFENTNYANKVDELEDYSRKKDQKLQEFSSIQSRNVIALKSMQNDVECKKDQICELLDKISCLNENGKKFQFSCEKKIAEHENWLREIASILNCLPVYNICLDHIKSIICSKTHLESQVARLNDSAGSFEFEQRAARETTLRLSGELNKEINSKESALTETRLANQELKKTKSLLDTSEANIRLLSSRVQSLTAALDKAHTEAEIREGELLRIASHNGSNCCVHPGSPNETSINLQQKRDLQRGDEIAFHDFINFARNYLNESKEISVLNILQQMKEIIANFEVVPQRDMQNTHSLSIISSGPPSISRDKIIGTTWLNDRIKVLEQERAEIGADVQKINDEREQIQSFIKKVADQLKLEEIAAEYEIPLLMDAITARINSLISGEGERSANQRVKISKMQKQIRELKDKNEAIQLQLNILRKRSTDSVESREITPSKHSSTAMLVNAEREKRRLSKQLEQTKEEFDNLQSENLRLKTQLLNVDSNSLEAIGTSKMIHIAETKLTEFQRQFDNTTEEQHNPRKSSSPSEYHKLKSNTALVSHIHEDDMNSTVIDDIKKSEKQLLKFRSTVARMLGLDCEQLAVPDVQIVDELERVIRRGSRGCFEADIASSYAENY